MSILYLTALMDKEGRIDLQGQKLSASGPHMPAFRKLWSRSIASAMQRDSAAPDSYVQERSKQRHLTSVDVLQASIWGCHI
ncbi:hypothetical protein Anapl_16107 [Anas platyrhynchos]|uniref:Uncharacterized protein n=1 Tax=Anas platyrhynchos TaxID=8839 RepID=R0K1U0_ANAPL|nr:hypothetical protein Anapl_16107 [Anas platyrhynchos]